MSYRDIVKNSSNDETIAAKQVGYTVERAKWAQSDREKGRTRCVRRKGCLPTAGVVESTCVVGSF